MYRNATAQSQHTLISDSFAVADARALMNTVKCNSLLLCAIQKVTSAD